MVYIHVDEEARIEGGDGNLRKKLERELDVNGEIDSANYDLAVLVAFIVKADGQVIGCRIINDRPVNWDNNCCYREIF